MTFGVRFVTLSKLAMPSDDAVRLPHKWLGAKYSQAMGRLATRRTTPSQGVQRVFVVFALSRPVRAGHVGGCKVVPTAKIMHTTSDNTSCQSKPRQDFKSSELAGWSTFLLDRC
jgi:hypothetical protein